MFDGPTTVHVDWDNGPGVVLDLSAVYANSEALPLVMVAATHWLTGALAWPPRTTIGASDRRSLGRGAPRRRLLPIARSSCHAPTASPPCSSATAPPTSPHKPTTAPPSSKIAAGLLSDIQTRVLLRQPPEQIAAAAEMFDLSERERDWLGQLVQGRAIWQIGARTAVVQTVLTGNERKLFDTDAAMTSRYRWGLGGACRVSRPPATTRWPIDDVSAAPTSPRCSTSSPNPTSAARRWHCPLTDHDDHHASVTMHRDHRGHERWRCWSGDQRHRGDAIDLVQAVRGNTRAEAIEELATRAGLQPGRELPPIAPRKPTAPPAVVLDERVVAYANICARLLWSPLGAPVRDWLHNRGLDDDVLARQPRRRRPRPRPTPPITRHPLRGRRRSHVPSPRRQRPDPLRPNTSARTETRLRQVRQPIRRARPEPRLTWAVPPGPAQPGQLLICEGIPDALIAAQAGYRSVGLLGTNALDPTVAARIANLATRDNLDITIITDNDDNGVGKHLGQQLAASASGTDAAQRTRTSRWARPLNLVAPRPNLAQWSRPRSPQRASNRAPPTRREHARPVTADPRKVRW